MKAPERTRPNIRGFSATVATAAFKLLLEMRERPGSLGPAPMDFGVANQPQHIA